MPVLPVDIVPVEAKFALEVVKTLNKLVEYFA